MHPEAAVGARVVAARGLPDHHVVLHTDGALVLDQQGLVGEGLVGDGGARVVGGDREAEPGRRLGPYPLDMEEEESYPVVGTPRLVGGHLVRDRRPDKGYRVDDAIDAVGDRRRVTDGTVVSGGITATLAGGGGQERGGVGGQVGLADRGVAIAKSYGPSATRSTHRGRATTLHMVLLVSGDIDPNNTSDVGGDDDLGAERRHSGCGWFGCLVGASHI